MNSPRIADGDDHLASVNFDSLTGRENVISTSSPAGGSGALTASAWRS